MKRQKGRIRRILALMVALAVLLSGMSLATPKSEANEGLVKNGEFENLDSDGEILAGWFANALGENNGSLKQVTEGGHKGAYARIQTDGTYAMNTDGTNLIQVEPGAVYRFSYWVKVPDAAASVIPYVYMYTETGAIADSYCYQLGSCIAEGEITSWKKIEGQIEVPMDTYQIALSFVLTHKSESSREIMAEIDSVSLEKVKDAAKTARQGAQSRAGLTLNNGGFETGDLDGWKNVTSGKAKTAVTDEKAAAGTYALKMDTTDGGQGSVQSNQITIEPGETYVVSYQLYIEDVNASGNDAQCYAYLYEFDSTGKTCGGGLVKSTGRWVSKNRWEEISFKYTMSETTQSIRLDFLHNAVAGISYWDEVVIEKHIPEIPLDCSYDHGGDEATAASDNLVKNSTFDGGSNTGWNVKDYAVVYKTEGNGGVLKMDATGGNFVATYSDIVLQPETVYELSYWVWAEEAKDLSFTSYVTGAGISWKDFLPFDITGNTGGWVKVTNRFVTPAGKADGEVKPLSIGFKSHYEGKATIYLDDIALLAKGEYQDAGEGRVSDDSVIRNGSFDRYAKDEYSADYWNLNRNWQENDSKAVIQKEEAKSGQAICIDATGHFYLYANDFSIESGKVYILSFWTKVENGDNLKFAAYMSDKHRGGSWWLDDATQPVYGNTDGWVKVSSAVTIPASVGNNSQNPDKMVQLGLQVYQGTGRIYVDDVSLTPTDIDAANPNLDLELDPGILYNWSLASYNGGNGSMSTSPEVRPGSTGKVSAVIQNIGANGDTHFVSQPLKVEPNTTYEISYWIKQEGSYSARMSTSFCQYQADQKTAAYSMVWDGNIRQVVRSQFLSPFWTYNTQGECSWRQVSLSVTTGAETEYLQLRFNQVGANTSTWLDDIQLRKVSKTPNLDFEYTSDVTGAPENWYMSMNGNREVSFGSDSSVYHSGNKSLYLKKESLLEKTLVESSVFFEVNPDYIYEYSAWVTARNASPDCTIRMNLYLYDENGNHLYLKDGNYDTLYGTVISLNKGEELGEWTQMLTRAKPPETAKYASISFTIARGNAEIWIDDIFCDVVEDGTDCVVSYSDFHAVDQDGNISGWELDSVSGNASFTGGKAGGILTKESGEAYMVSQMKYIMTDYVYCIKGNYTSDIGGVAEMRFYDYKGNEYEELREQVPILADGTEFVMNFTAPSNTLAKLYIGGEQAGRMNVKNVTVYMTGKPAGKGDWNGYWVWYPEDAVKDAVEEYRYFRYVFTLDEEPEYAPMQLTVDDKFDFYVNGELIESNMEEEGDDWGNVRSFDLTGKFHKGKNIIAIKAYNRVSQAAVLFDGRFKMANKTEVIVGSSSQVVSAKTANDTSLDWTKLDYNDSSWVAAKEYGQPPISPWGSVFYNSSLYLHNEAEVLSVEIPEKVISGKNLVFTMTLKLEEPIGNNFTPMVDIYKRNSLTRITSAPMTLMTYENPMEWPVGEAFEVECSVTIPDYMETGKYELQMDDTMLLLNGKDVNNNRFVSFSAQGSSTGRDKVVAKVEEYNGTPTLMIDGEPQGAYFYLRPDLKAYLQNDAESRMYKSDLELYITYGGQLYLGGTDPIWLEGDVIDYEAFDSVIQDTLGANSNALVMVNIAMFVPQWWLNENPEAEVLSDNGTTYIKTGDVSLASEKYRQEAGEVLRQLIRHMKEQSYYNRVFGLKIGGGISYEWMVRGTSATQGGDYSQASREGFKKYLKEKYGTVEELRKAWGNNSVTFETAEAPGWNEKADFDNLYLGDISTGTLARNIVDWNLWLNEAATDSFLYYCQIAKEETDGDVIVGGYNGYLWTTNTLEGQGKAHNAMERVLESEYVDFIASPISYSGERILGNSNTYMPMIDTVQEYGKLYIAEQDNRTCLSAVYAGQSWDAAWDFSIGQTRTLADTIHQEKRDFAHAITDGVGQWLYDMYGGWLDDDQIYDYIRDAKAEYDFSVYLDRDVRNEVAVFVGDETYANMSANESQVYSLLDPMYRQQRSHLASMGVGYDTYAMSSLLDGKVSDHKVNIILSPFEITEEMQKAIDTYLKKDGKYLVWVYLPGISTGDNLDLKNVARATGFQIGIEERKAGLKVVMADVEHPLTKGIQGEIYGTTSWSSVSPITYIADTAGTTVLGYNQDGGKAGLAIRDMGEWTSIYSSAPCLDVDFLRNLLVMAGCHIYSESNADVIYSSNHYVALHSSEAGYKTIKLPGNYSVYDVFAEEFVSMNTDTISYMHETDDTHIFRLMTPNHYAVTARLKSGKGTLSAPGLTEVAEGGSYSLTVTPEEGYELTAVTVNGKEVELVNNTFSVESVNENYVILVRFNRLPEMEEVITIVEELIVLPWWAFFTGVAVIALLITAGRLLWKKKRHGNR